jgi:hypothetical protein
MEDAAFVILGPGLLFLATMAGGWVVIVVGAGAEGAPGCAVLAWLLGHLHPGFLVEYPGPGLAAYAGLACGISLGLRTAESAAPSRVGKSVLPDAGHCHTPIAYFRQPVFGRRKDTRMLPVTMAPAQSAGGLTHEASGAALRHRR